MKRLNFLLSTATVVFGSLSVGIFSAANAFTVVDLELSLLADVSGSVDNNEFNLQRQGYANAFNNSALFNAISQGTLGQIAVNYIEWSGAGQQQEIVGWTLIDSFADAQAFANALNPLTNPRPFGGATAPGSAINYATNSINTNAFDAARQVIDVSGDGPQNDGFNTATARDNALAAGVDTINGLVIGGSSTVKTFYENNVIGGTDAFVVEATDFNTFETAILNKLEREIVGGDPEPVPEPLTIISSGLILGFGALFNKQKAKSDS